MGGAVSAGANNDELIDNLLEADYIKSANVERVFRAVDRGHYFTKEYKERAYRDLAWKCGNLHISAPCIYSRVMENLQLGPGMSFLNIGSGTGYLSTMAGLLLGCYGTNHGVEIHEDVLNYSTKKLDEFVSTSSAIDEYEFCVPKFVCGNCLYLGSNARQYDRVYCGAACPKHHENYMKNLIKVGGILVMPINDQLLQICRTSDTNWESKSVLPVTFATLISGKIPDCIDPLKMPEADPLSLQDICRFTVRSILRRNIEIEHPELKKPPRVPRKRIKKRTFRRLVVPILNGDSDGEEELEHQQPMDDRHHFLMNVTDVQLLGAIEAQYESDTDSHRSSLSGCYRRENEIMEEDSNFFMSHDDSNVEDMSNDEYLSDIEELHGVLASGGASTSAVCLGNTVEESTKKSSLDVERSINQNKLKREKIDSGIVEDIETNREINCDLEREGTISNDNDENVLNISVVEDKLFTFSDDQGILLKGIDIDTNDESYEYFPKECENENSANTIDSVPVVLTNYSTYMKEKITLLPLPMTLKFFLNFNRDL